MACSSAQSRPAGLLCCAATAVEPDGRRYGLVGRCFHTQYSQCVQIALMCWCEAGFGAAREVAWAHPENSGLLARPDLPESVWCGMGWAAVVEDDVCPDE